MGFFTELNHPLYRRPKKTCLDRSERENGFNRESKPVEAPETITLTEEQQGALESLRAFVRSDKDVFLLAGYAGTGKTTVLQHWLKSEMIEMPEDGVCTCGHISVQHKGDGREWCYACSEKDGWSECTGFTQRQMPRRAGRRVAFAAPTNKATRVLMEMASANGLSVKCTTVHKLLKMRVMSDAEKKYASRRNSVLDEHPIEEFDVVVVDEASMVGNEPRGPQQEPGLYDTLLDEAKSYGVKIIFVGDPAQLPPVQDSESPAFTIPDRVQLTHVVRQALDNPILAFATWIRRSMAGEDAGPEPSFEGAMVDGVGVAIYDRKTWLEKVVEAYDREPDHPTRYKVLAGRNKEVDDINRYVRQCLLGCDAPPFMPEERLIATEPVPIWVRGEIVGVGMTTDEEAIVVSAERADHPLFPEYKAWHVDLMTYPDAPPFETYIVDPSEYDKWLKDVESIGRREAQGNRRFYLKWNLNDAFAHMKHCYAMTVHRSQGSTYDEVFVDGIDLKSWPDKNTMGKLLYTACTRPRKALHLC